MKELAECIECAAKAMVDNPDAVSARVVEKNGLVIELSVANEDLGKVIGKNGRTVEALRTILSAAAANHQTACRLEIVE
ncbi:MAG: KH domain-containing protein [Proteobacteria bacterium]|jgi:predicted RNA-binding protein YlqC (UPF0109 family)|nr:KH domain-containing protein [Pseudomonadota bacterium]